MKLISNEAYSKEEFDKRLRFQTEPVKMITPMLQHLAVDLLEEMYKMNAVGLAANQVGLKVRLCVIDPLFVVQKKHPVVMFNPEVVECGDEIFHSTEGCLSLPGMDLTVPRFQYVKVKFMGLDGKEYLIQSDTGSADAQMGPQQLLASVIQHEIDHLDGVLMIDRALEEVDVKYSSV